MGIGPGSRLDTYEILAPLGAGGMGEVWLARDLRLDRKVALKVLPSQLAEDTERVARFQQEARAASALNHPNVCTIHALGVADDGRLFIAMEYIDGATLRQLLATGRRSLPETLDHATQIASALAAAHAASVIHRDLKPENVMVRGDGLVKVLDFGLAKLAPTLSACETAQSTRTSLPSNDGRVMGTIAYMSPEQARAEPLDARTDIFSVGTVLYEMVTGRRAFPGNSTAVVLDGILNRLPTAPTHLDANVPPRLEDIIDKALEKDRELRYQTASELRADLIRLKRDTDASGVIGVRDTSAVARSRTSRYRSRTAAALAALMLAAILVIVAVRSGALQLLVSRSELQEVQLTTNSPENPVSAAAISPDGKYLAYSDLTGLHLRVIDSGETHTIATPDIGDINRVLWFPDGSKLVVSGEGAVKGARPAIWSVSIVGGSPRKLAEDGLEACVSLDGSQIAFVEADRRRIWIMGANGEDPHPVVTTTSEDVFHLPAWTNAWLDYARVRSTADTSGTIKTEILVERRDREGRTAVVFTDPGLRAGIALPDGRWLYSVVAEPTLNRDASLWEARSDPQTGGLHGNRRVRQWPASVSLLEFTSSSDGKRVAFLKRSPQKDVYLADLTSGGDAANPRRFTLDDSDDFATNWMPDSGAILFSSNRNGNLDIFRQSLDGRIAEAVVAGPDDESGPTAVSPDGTWFYYYLHPKGWRSTMARGLTIMRTPVSGGARQKIADDSGRRKVLCARSPSTTCVLVEHEGRQFGIYALDPLQGKGRTIMTTELESSAAYWYADLSRDGLALAILIPNENRIRILSLQGEAPRDVTITGWPLDPAAFYWSADGAGWYVSSTSARYPGGTDLLHIDLKGHVKVVWHQNVRDWTAGIPSPNGRHLALTHSTIVSNVWMIKGF